jgi:hypothetical protein
MVLISVDESRGKAAGLTKMHVAEDSRCEIAEAWFMLWRIADGVSFVEVSSIRPSIACFLNIVPVASFPGKYIS